MNFTHQDQIYFAKLALALIDHEKTNPKSLEAILEFGELIKKYADENNAVIYDTTEYVYEQLRLARNEEGAFDNVEQRQQIEKAIQDSGLNRQ